MADDTQTQTADPQDQTQALIQQMLRQTLSPQSYQPPEPPHSGDNRTWGSLLGQALVGGGGPGSTDAQNERAGLQALSNIGLGMMSGSDYSQARHSLGSIVAGAIGGAQESNAAQNAAQLEYQKTQQEMQLARVKEAIPLLSQLTTLQQAAAARNLALGKPPTAPGANTSIGAVGSNTYESAIGGHEGLGADSRLPTTVGGFIPSTWQGFVAANPDLFKGMTADQQMAARSDPKLNAAGITWLAQQNADALTKAGVTPSGTSLGIAHYLGAGAAAKALQASDDTPVRNFVSADAIKYNPELGTMTVGQLKQRYANVPAPSFLAPKQPGPPAVAGTPQTPPGGAPGVAQGDVAHPELAPGPPGSTGGAPIGIGAALAPPVVAGTPLPAGKLQSTGKPPGQAAADIIQSGVQLAQATPLVRGTGQEAGPSSAVATLATPATPQPGWGTGAATGYNMGPTGAAAPPSPPAAVVTAQTPPAPALPPAAAPSFSFERGPLPASIQSRIDNPAAHVSPDLTTALQVAATSGDIAKMAAAKAAVGAAADAVRTKAIEEGEAYQTNERNKAQELFVKNLDIQQQNQQQQQTFDQQLKLKSAEGEQQRLTNKEAVFNQANQKGLETEQAEQANAHGVVQQLEGFRSISDNVGQPNWLQTTKFPGTDQSIAERLQQAGVVKLDDTAGVQLLRGGITNLVKTLRAGMPMGSLSDRDLNFIERMGPTEWMDPDTRSAAVGYLQQAYRANEQFHRDVQREMSRGRNYGDAFDAVSARQKSFVPQVPADLTTHWSDNTGNWPQQRADWAERNDVRPGTLIHMDNGKIAVVRRPRAAEQR